LNLLIATLSIPLRVAFQNGLYLIQSLGTLFLYKVPSLISKILETLHIVSTISLAILPLFACIIFLSRHAKSGLLLTLAGIVNIMLFFIIPKTEIALSTGVIIDKGYCQYQFVTFLPLFLVHITLLCLYVIHGKIIVVSK
jgi:hypothetical protein